MPPSRRRPPATPPPGRRPRVAGLRQPEAPKKPDPTPDESPTQIIEAVPAEQAESRPTTPKATRPTENVVTTAGAEESLSTRRARRAQARAEKESTEEASEPAEKTSGDSNSGVPSWVSSAGSNVRGMTDGTKIVILACAAVVLAAFGVFAGFQWHQTAFDANTQNTSYIDVGTTSQVKGEVIDAVQKVFTYTYANPNQTEQDAQNVLTGVALCQYNALFKNVVAQAPAQQITVTTSIDQSNSGVEQLQGDQARLLLMINQETTRGSNGQKVTSQAVLEVGAIQQNGSWKVDNLSTFGTGPNANNCK